MPNIHKAETIDKYLICSLAILFTHVKNLRLAFFTCVATKIFYNSPFSSCESVRHKIVAVVLERKKRREREGIEDEITALQKCISSASQEVT